MLRSNGVFIVLLFLTCTLWVGAQQPQRGKLSTTVTRDKPRWIPRSSPSPLPLPQSANLNISAISGNSAEESEDTGKEKDVLEPKAVPITRPVSTSTSPDDVSLDKDEKIVSTTAEHNKSLNRTSEGNENESVSTEEVVKDDRASTGNPENEKVPTKRDLPFVIQSSPGLPVLNENLLRGFTPIHEPFDEFSFDQEDSRPQQLQQRSDTEYSNTPQVFTTKQQQPQQQQQQAASRHSFVFSTPHTSQNNYQSQYHNHPQHQQSPLSQYAHQPTNQQYHQSLGNNAGSLAASASHLSFQVPTSFSHSSVHDSSAPTSNTGALKLSYNPYMSTPQLSIIAAAPSNKFASLTQAQPSYFNYVSAANQQQQQQATGSFATPTYQYLGYATTVQPQFIQYQASPTTVTGANAQTYPLQQQANQVLLGRIPHHQPITDYTYHNPNIIHAHNQNLFASNFAKVSNTPAVFNNANTQSLYQLSPYAYPVQAAFQVGSSAGFAPGTANVKPYQFQQHQVTPSSASVAALTASSPTLATPQYKHFSGAALSAAAAYNINRNEAVQHQQQTQFGGFGPTIATIKVNPYNPFASGVSHSINPQHQSNAFAFGYAAKPIQISPYGFQQTGGVAQQQSPLQGPTLSYTSPTYTQLLSPAASTSQQQGNAYFVNAPSSSSSFYAPNKYQSTFSQIGGTPHKVLYASH